MGTVLIDVRCLQGGADPAMEPLLAAARAALPDAVLVGLTDAALPTLPERVANLVDRVRTAAGSDARDRPACLVQLSPLHDPLFVAGLLADPAIASVTVPLPDGPAPSEPAARVARAVARYWHRRYHRVANAAALWASAAALRPPTPALRPGQARVALLDPAPSAGLVSALRDSVDLHVFTGRHGFSALPILSGRFDRVLGVVADSPLHAPVAALLERYGGACLLLDAGLPTLHHGDAALAKAELGRALGPDELDRWQAGDLRPAASFLGPLARATDTLIVPTSAMADMIGRRFGRRPSIVPRPVASCPVAPRAPGPPRTRSGDVLIAAMVADGLEASCLWALDLLRFWGVTARLALSGPAVLPDLCAPLGVTDRVALAPPGAWAAADLLLALAVGPATAVSAELQDAAVHGVPCVAAETVAEAVTEAGWIRTVPDEPSPVLLAEAILAALAARPDPDELHAYAARHTPAQAAARLYTALGL